MWAESPGTLPDSVRHSDALRQVVQMRVMQKQFRGRICDGVHTLFVKSGGTILALSMETS